MRELLTEKFSGAMRGHTMYVVPFRMGPLGSPIAEIGVQLTDSAYVAVSMRIMTRMGKGALDVLGDDGDFVPCLHSVGAPTARRAWPCNEEKYIVHFPETREIWSYGSGYGGNALLGKKCLALRIASVMARDEGWLAEHMLIISSPRRRASKYIDGRVPERLRQDQPRDDGPDPPGLEGRDDRRRHRVDEVRRRRPPLRRQPRGRLLRRRARHQLRRPTRTRSRRSEANTIFTNCAKTDDGDVWWEGMTPKPPAHAIDWQGNDWTPDSDEPAAHPNARFTTPAAQCPSIAAEWEDPAGVPIDAFLFGGRRADVVPLVREAFDWEHGVFIGATMSSETTAAAAGEVGALRFDPMAMLPFCGYNMADYFGALAEARPPRGREAAEVFYVNWFRKDDDGKFLWPGFGENSRVLAWIFRRLDGERRGRETPIGSVPGRRGPRHQRPRPRRARRSKELLTVDEDSCAPSSTRSRSSSTSSATGCRQRSARSSRRSRRIG